MVPAIGPPMGKVLDGTFPVSVDAEAAAWANTVANNGGAVSSARFALVRRLLYRWDEAGIRHLVDHANAWWGEDEVQARVGLRSLLVATAVNSPTFAANVGVTGNGTTSYYDTGFIPATHGRAITGGFHHIGAQVLTNVSGTMSVMGAGGGATTRLRPRTAANVVGVQIEAAFGSFVDSVTDSTGYISAQRAGTSTIQGRKDDTALTDLTVGTLNTNLPTGPTFVLARNNNGTPAEYYTGQAGFTYECAPLTSAQWSAMRASILEFGQGVGAIA